MDMRPFSHISIGVTAFLFDLLSFWIPQVRLEAPMLGKYSLDRG